MKKVIGIFLTLLMALSLSGYSGIGTAIRGGRTSEQPEATKTPAPEATAGQEPEDPGILVSPAEEYAFRMELFDKNWSYERPAFEGGAYEITTDSPSAFAIIRTALVTYPDDFVDDEVLDGFNDYLANHYTNAGEGGRLRVLEKRTFPVGDGSGRALIGQIAVGEEYASLAIVSWAKKGEGPHDSFLYFALALTDPPAFEAACSEMKMMLMSFNPRFPRGAFAAAPLTFRIQRRSIWRARTEIAAYASSSRSEIPERFRFGSAERHPSTSRTERERCWPPAPLRFRARRASCPENHRFLWNT